MASLNGKRREARTTADLSAGMVFAYEQPIFSWREELEVSRRVLRLQYIGESSGYGKRHIFVVIGVSRGDPSWSPGHLFLDAQTVERSLGVTLRLIP